MYRLSALIDYHYWANAKVLEKLAGVEDADWKVETGGSFPTLSALYTHVLGGDYRWLQRWKGVPIADIPAHFAVKGYATLDSLWRPLMEEMVVTATEALAADPEKPVYFITARGLHVTQPFWQTLYQVVNHGTYHRGQAVDKLRTLGHEGVSTDIFLFFRERGGEAQ